MQCVYHRQPLTTTVLVQMLTANHQPRRHYPCLPAAWDKRVASFTSCAWMQLLVVRVLPKHCVLRQDGTFLFLVIQQVPHKLAGSLDAGGSLPAPQPQTSGPRPRRRWVAAGNANKDTASIHHVSESSSDALLEANSPKALLGDVRVPSDAGMMLHGRPTQAAGAQPPAALPCLAEVEGMCVQGFVIQRACVCNRSQAAWACNHAHTLHIHPHTLHADPSLHSLGATSSTSLEPLPSSNPSQPASLVGSTHPSTHLSSQSSPHYLPAMRKGMPLDDDFDAMLNTLAVQDAHMERAADADTEEKSTTKTNSHPRAVVKPRQRVDASTAPHAAADSNGKGSTRVVDGRVLVQLVPVESSGTVACSLKLGKRAPQQGGGRARGGGSAGRGRGMQGRRASGPPVRTASAVNRFGGADHEDEEGPAPLAAITGPLKVGRGDDCSSVCSVMVHAFLLCFLSVHHPFFHSDFSKMHSKTSMWPRQCHRHHHGLGMLHHHGQRGRNLLCH